MTIKFSDHLSRILAIEPHKFSDVEMTVKSSNTCDIEGGLHAMYAYCDVLECVPVGDTMAPLLRIVEINGQKGEMVHIQYDQPRYVPLQKKEIDSIEVDIGVITKYRNGPKWTEMDRNGPKWTEMDRKGTEMDRSGTKWERNGTEMDRNGKIRIIKK